MASTIGGIRARLRIMRDLEKRALQCAIALGSLVPISAGAAGVLMGPRMLSHTAVVAGDLDSHFRYLSGLLLGIGLAYVSTIPAIETRQQRFRLLTVIVVVGGLGRLLHLLSSGFVSRVSVAALAMELLVTPGLALWQWRVARMFC
ncbi:MAG TPA: DUF4345 family protein [Acetobacteraceae bacterium]